MRATFTPILLNDDARNGAGMGAPGVLMNDDARNGAGTGAPGVL